MGLSFQFIPLRVFHGTFFQVARKVDNIVQTCGKFPYPENTSQTIYNSPISLKIKILDPQLCFAAAIISDLHNIGRQSQENEKVYILSTRVPIPNMTSTSTGIHSATLICRRATFQTLCCLRVY